MQYGHFAVVVEGLFEKSDSIGYDAIFQYELIKALYGEKRVRIFSERFDTSLHKDIKIEPMAEYWKHIKDVSDVVTIYHYCDGWALMDDHVLASQQPVIVRWHNNTPPWFYGAAHRNAAVRTVAGFRTILNFIEHAPVRFWVNSNFTLDQLTALGATQDRAAVVYPGSRFLALPDAPTGQSGKRALPIPADRPIRFLFVSRVVAHKGHRHVLQLAAAVQETLARPVSVTFLGRDDPATTLRTDLARYAAEVGVDVTLKGEVGEAELHAAYADADLFICFSEHEGFGMPVFEAMRVGVPVICWGRTALRELMADHPLTLDRLDLVRAVAAVQLVADGGAGADCEVVQNAILSTYTRDIVAKQLTAAIEGRVGPWRGAPVLPDDAAGFAAARMRANLEPALANHAQGPVLPALQPCEAGENLVTVYDIQSYEALMRLDRGLDRLPAQEVPADFVLFSHREFVTAGGQRLDDGIAFAAHTGAESKTHVIFGPYERFVRGYFSAEFLIEAEQSGDPGAELELDIAIEGGAPLARMRISARQLQSGATPRLLFPIATDHAVVEFRTVVKRRRNCNFLFKGVAIRNMRQSVTSLRDGPRMSLFGLRWMRRPSLPRLIGAVRIPPLAGRHFARADRLRDREWWNDAAEAYAVGLRYHNSFDHLVQMGNCLKEARRLEESEAAYQAALALRPHDQDAHLQIGRLYRVWDKPEEMHYHLIRAARIERASAEALRELAEGGFDLTSLAAIYG